MPDLSDEWSLHCVSSILFLLAGTAGLRFAGVLLHLHTSPCLRTTLRQRMPLEPVREKEENRVRADFRAPFPHGLPLIIPESLDKTLGERFTTQTHSLLSSSQTAFMSSDLCLLFVSRWTWESLLGATFLYNFLFVIAKQTPCQLHTEVHRRRTAMRLCSVFQRGFTHFVRFTPSFPPSSSFVTISFSLYAPRVLPSSFALIA